MPRQKDPKAATSKIVIKDFPGYAPNADPHDLPPGSAVKQVNAMSWKPGELRIRLGYVPVNFDS